MQKAPNTSFGFNWNYGFIISINFTKRWWFFQSLVHWVQLSFINEKERGHRVEKVFIDLCEQNKKGVDFNDLSWQWIPMDACMWSHLLKFLLSYNYGTFFSTRFCFLTNAVMLHYLGHQIFLTYLNRLSARNPAPLEIYSY